MSVSKKRIHVAVGVIKNHRNEILIAQRSADSHQGGLWEFPGGKVEVGESVPIALQRELKEELNILARQPSPLIKIHHDYPDISVLLDVWQVDSFEGEPAGLQGQPLRWVSAENLQDYDFPVANKPIVTVLRMPREMMITGKWKNPKEFLQRLQNTLEKGVRLVQLRAHHSSPGEYVQLFQQAKYLCDGFQALLIANTSLDVFSQLSASGIHLTAQRLLALTQRPVDHKTLLGASCHNKKEMEQANLIGVDYVLLGPVYQTDTHPEVTPLGIEVFSGLVAETALPVFALGGLKATDKEKLLEAGAYGIAGIKFWW